MSFELLPPGIDTVVGKMVEKPISSATEKIFSRGAEALGRLEGHKVKTPKLIEGITEHLKDEGLSGSEAFMKLFSESTILHTQLLALENGHFDPKLFERAGLPIMVDAQCTTPDMIRAGQAVLTQEARISLLGSVNSLRSKLDVHISKTAQKASEYYTAERLKGPDLLGGLQRMLGIKAEPFEIPFSPSPEEVARIEELREADGVRVNYITKEETHSTFTRKFREIMEARPASIDLGSSASLREGLRSISIALGGVIADKSPVNIAGLELIPGFMKNHCMRELQIYPGFGEAIEKSIQNDLLVPLLQ